MENENKWYDDEENGLSYALNRSGRNGTRLVAKRIMVVRRRIKDAVYDQELPPGVLDKIFELAPWNKPKEVVNNEK